jgi:ABC-type sugar transport system ATPase subunit
MGDDMGHSSGTTMAAGKPPQAATTAPTAAVSLGTSLLSVKNVTKGFGGALVLHGIDLDLYPGEIVALMGENGAGKSTLLNIVSGAMQPDGGELRYAGQQRRWQGPRNAMDAGIAVVHQELSVIGAMSVAENMFLGDYCARHGLTDPTAMRARAEALLAEIDAHHIKVGTPMERLRIADQQAVEIAKALRLDLKLLLLDEPTSSLTPHEVDGLFRLLRKLKDRGTAIVFISHRIEEALALCDRIVVLRDGRLISTLPVADTNRGRIVADMAGREVPTGASRPVFSTGEEVLAAEGIGDGGLVEDISFRLHRGEILGLFGLVGAGRTEVLEMLFGVRPMQTGRLSVLGKPFRPQTPKQAIEAGFALLPEGRKVNGILPFRPVAENLSLMALPHLVRSSVIDRRAEGDLVAKAIADLGIILHSPGQPISTLSGGNQQKCILARCLAVNPSLLLLDEPTHGVDVRTKEQIYQIIRSLADQGMAIVVASSEMVELFQIASRILVLSNGRASGMHQVATTTPVDLMRDAFRFLS